jgi:gluconolactonase
MPEYQRVTRRSGDVMRTGTLSFGLLLALSALSVTRAAEPPNMQQASPIPLVPDGKALATRVIRLDPSLDHIISPNAQVSVVKGDNYFGVIEGGAWVPDDKSGYLLFSDFVANVIYKWAPDSGQLSVFLNKSGYTGNLADYTGRITTTQYGAPLYVYDLGANGIALDPQGRVVLCAHGDREIVRLEQDGTRTVLATGYQDNRFYHPNEMAIKSDGAIYITDARGLGSANAQDAMLSGVYRVKDGTVSLAITGQAHGIAFSPDEKFAYVTYYGSQAITRYDVQPDGTFENGTVFVDMSGQKTRGAPNGMAVDREGNVYSAGPGGLWITNPAGKHIGTIPLPALAANAVFGGGDLKTLYILDSRNLLQVRLKVPGTALPARLTGEAAQK